MCTFSTKNTTLYDIFHIIRNRAQGELNNQRHKLPILEVGHD